MPEVQASLPTVSPAELPQTEPNQQAKPARSKTPELTDDQSGTQAEKIRLKFKTKIDDIEEEVELDEDQIKRDYQRMKASDKRFQEASTLRKQADEFISKLKDKQGLIEVLRQAGHDPRALAEEFLGNELRVELMTPEQKRIYELERDLFITRQTQKQRDDQEMSAKEAQATEKLSQQMNQEIIEALKSANIPQEAYSVRRMADIIRNGFSHGEVISWSDAAKILERDIKTQVSSVVKKMSPEKILETFGEEVANTIRKYDLSKLQNPIRQSRRQNGQAALPKEPGRTYTTEKEFERHLEAIKAQRK